MRLITRALAALLLVALLSGCTPAEWVRWQQDHGLRARNSDEVRQFVPRSEGGLAPLDSPHHPVCYQQAGGRRANPCPAGTTGPLSAFEVALVRWEAASVTAALRSLLASPEQHVRAAAREFGIPEDAFVRVIRCESGMDPRAVNPSSGALGLGQHLPRYWPARASALGYPASAWSDARANARVSAWLWRTAGPGHWVCR